MANALTPTTPAQDPYAGWVQTPSGAALAPPLAMPSSTGSVDPRWHQPQYVVKERHFTLGRQYRIFDGAGQLVAYCKQKLFKLREDVRFYTDESQAHELFRLQTARIIDFNANFMVIDSATERVLGTLRRKGWKSLLRDEWHVLDPVERPWAILREDSGLMALIRRFLISWIPHTYFLYRDANEAGQRLATIKERFQIFGDTYDLHIQPGIGIDARVLLGLTVCIDAMESE